MARFARTLGTLLGNGVSLLPALTIVKDTVENRALAGSLDGVLARLKAGQGFRPTADGNRPLPPSWRYTWLPWVRKPAASTAC